LRISFEELMALGRANPDDPNEPFNMAYLAVRGAGAINGVSELHGAVSRSILLPLFPRWPLEEIPVGSVTNGIHTVSWDSEHSDRLWSGVCGKDRWFGTTERIGDQIRGLSDDALWKFEPTIVMTWSVSCAFEYTVKWPPMAHRMRTLRRPKRSLIPTR
jgi:glycogen phosphorylase